MPKFMFVFCLLFGCWSSSVMAEDDFQAVTPIRIVTSEFPPYSFSAGDQAEGIAVALVENMLEQMGLNIKIEVYPWARAYDVALREPNTLLFVVARTPEREPLFKWVGRLILFDVKVFRLKSAEDIHIKQLEELHNYKVGSLIKDVKGAYLKSKGIKPIEYASEDSGIHMLKRGYIDLMPAELNSFRYRVSKLGYQQDDFEVAYELSEISNPLYLAFSKGTPDELVVRFREALSKLPLDQGVLSY
ncbi:amino acid ABC transporter substrate-binding protein, PAAT family (TC 3.A.1.3.-) [Oceanospirillum multiglobuliferum]|nr:ABC transporter substrate-binding protein [Oceanospirillum multiglobuliferum]SJZ94385.1 amino acid ABC transporter substrate-binding protein, PAAT family (TC 3.A.1.3.-) [Oceanospirillum multiglobuliferum]